MNTGHIAGLLMHQSDFCKAITDTFHRLTARYHLPEDNGNDGMRKKYENCGSQSSVQLMKPSTENKKRSYILALLKSLKVFAVKS